MVGLEPGEEAERGALACRQRQRCVLQHGHRMLVLLTHAAQARALQRGGRAACSCRQAMELDRVGAKALRAPQRSGDEPRMAAADAEVLPHRQHDAARRVLQRRVVDVLAEVVLVQPHRGVLRERNVLRADEIHRLGVRAGVLQRDVPEPRRRRLGQHQRHAKGDALPLTRDVQRVGVEPHRARAARPEQRRPLHARAVAPQVQVGRAALQFVAEEGVHDHRAAIDAMDRPIGVHVHRQPGRTGKAQRNRVAHDARIPASSSRPCTTRDGTANAPPPRWCSVCSAVLSSRNDQRPRAKTRSSACAETTSPNTVS